MQKTKILATLGPASANPVTFKKMLSLGLSGVRINVAHGSFEEYKKTVSLVKKYSDLPIIVDVKGPELRLKLREKQHVKKGEEIVFSKESKEGISFNQDVYSQLKKSDKLIINDGAITGTITKTRAGKITVIFAHDALLEPNKSVNVPLRHLKLPPLSQKDKKAILFAKKEGLDFIALSFTRNKKDIENLQKHIGKSNLGIIAKIENQEGIDNIDDILLLVDGIMVARGDLGVELQTQKIPLLQKKLIKKANALGKIVIVATQVLESMIQKPYPTRAETSDIANAILDGADVIMLSEESAMGKYPSKCVSVIKTVAKEIEPFVKNTIPTGKLTDTISDAISTSAYDLVQHTNIDSIVAVTRSGYTACLLSRFRMDKTILAITSDPFVKRKLHLSYGVHPYLLSKMPLFEKFIHCSTALVESKLVKVSDTLLIVAGLHAEQSQISNVLYVAKASGILRCDIQDRT